MSSRCIIILASALAFLFCGRNPAAFGFYIQAGSVAGIENDSKAGKVSHIENAGFPGTVSGGIQAARETGKLNDMVAKILHSEEFDGASVGILALTESGDTLLCIDPARQLLPASNLKLVTTALALHALGGDYRYFTSLGYTGSISDGVLHGDLYIIGGGDPTLGSHNSIAEPLEELFAQWTAIVRGAGIEMIDGYIIGDGRIFPGMMEQGSWQIDDSGTYYGSGVSGLSFYENELDFSVAPSGAEGEPLAIEPVYPDVPWMSITYDCTTGKAGSGNTLYFYTSNFAPVGVMRGTFALDRKPKVEGAANKFPEYTMACHFTDYLRGNGVGCTCGPADLGNIFYPEKYNAVSVEEGFVGESVGDVGENDGESVGDVGAEGDEYIWEESGLFTEIDFAAPPAEELTVIGGTMSPSLSRIAGQTNHESNNMYAETMFKTLGMELAGEGTYDAAYKAVKQLLAELGVSDKNTVIRDGSGLSRENHVSAAFLCSLLRAMTESPSYPEFLHSLPWPGSEGTLQYTFRSLPKATRERIRMKSGSMGGVRCFSGYILPAAAVSNTPAATNSNSTATTISGAGETGTSNTPAATGPGTGETIIFSILVNNFSVSAAALQPRLEEIILMLAE